MQQLGLEVVPSVANFILVKFPQSHKSAKQADDYLLQNGYILRYLPELGLHDYLRMTVGTKEQNEAVITLLKDFMQD